MKKYLLSIGSIAAAMAPIVTVVSCGNEKKPVVTPKTDADFGKEILAKKTNIKTYAETLTEKAMTPTAIKTKTMELVGPNYKVLAKGLTVTVEKSTIESKMKITLTVNTQAPIVIDDVTPVVLKTDADFKKAIEAKKNDIKKYAETLTKEAMTSEAIKTKTMELVGTTYDALKVDLMVKVENSMSKGKMKIKLTVGTQEEIVIGYITPKKLSQSQQQI